MSINSGANKGKGMQGSGSSSSSSQVKSQQASTAGKVNSALENPVSRQVGRTSKAASDALKNK